MSTSAPGSRPPIEAGRRADSERAAADQLATIFARAPIPAGDLLANLHVFLRRQTLSRILFLQEIYRLVLEQPGIIVQCGVRWGGDLVTFSSLRATLEPYNYSRRIVGFDTFEGLKGAGDRDQPTAAGTAAALPAHAAHDVRDGQYNVAPGYEDALDAILQSHEAGAPLAHIRKSELVKGDVRTTLPAFLDRHPGEIIALLYLDMDIYAPTKAALEAVDQRLVKGSVVVFDELLHRQFPGEAQALREWPGRQRLRLRRSPFHTVAAYGIVE
jgi:hypothetical protein